MCFSDRNILKTLQSFIIILLIINFIIVCFLLRIFLDLFFQCYWIIGKGLNLRNSWVMIHWSKIVIFSYGFIYIEQTIPVHYYHSIVYIFTVIFMWFVLYDGDVYLRNFAWNSKNYNRIRKISSAMKVDCYVCVFIYKYLMYILSFNNENFRLVYCMAVHYHFKMWNDSMYNRFYFKIRRSDGNLKRNRSKFWTWIFVRLRTFNVSKYII